MRDYREEALIRGCGEFRGSEGSKTMKTKGKPPAKSPRKRKNPGGRPSKCTPKTLRLIEDLALAGFSDEKISKLVGISRSTLGLRKKDDKEFSDRVFRNRELAQARVARALFERAIGYKVKSVRIFADPKSGKVVQVPFWEHWPPSEAACMTFLKNRCGDLWKDKVTIEQSKDGLAARLRAARRRAEQAKIGASGPGKEAEA